MCENQPACTFSGKIWPILKRHNLQNIRIAKGYLDRIQPWVVLCAGHRYNKLGIWAKLQARFCCSKPQWKLFLSVHNSISPGLQGQTWLGKKQRTWAVSQLYPKALGIISVSRGIRQELIQALGLPPEKITTIHNPLIDLAHKSKHPPPPHPWQQDRQGPIILGAGRLVRQKDFSTLIRAFALVRKKLPARLIIIGEGKEREKLGALINELGLSAMIDLPGFVPNPFDFMAHADLFVLSSLWEGFGNVLVEALSVGLPVISTDCPHGPAEILEPISRRHPTCLVPIKDHQRLAKSILDTLANPPDKGLLLQRAQDFDLQRISKCYLEYFTHTG